MYRRVSLATTSLINHERGKDRILRQTEHIRDHLWPAYSVTVNHVLVSTVKLSKWWFQLNLLEPLVQYLPWNNTLSKKSWHEPQALEYRINWEIYNPYAGAAGILLHINGKFTIEKKLNHLFCHKVSCLTGPQCQFLAEHFSRSMCALN